MFAIILAAAAALLPCSWTSFYPTRENSTPPSAGSQDAARSYPVVAAFYAPWPRRGMASIHREAAFCSQLSASHRRCGDVSTRAASGSENNAPPWLPASQVLRELAAGERVLSFYCLREAGADRKAACVCEVSTGDTSLRAYHFASPPCEGKVTGESGAPPAPVRRFFVAELPFAEGKLGGHVWDGGALMAAWALTSAAGGGVAAGGAELFAGRRVLELGAGLGLLGIALAGSVADSVVLTDFGPAEGDMPVEGDTARLIPDGLLHGLRANVEANSLRNAEVRHLDWHDYLSTPPKVPEERFDRIVASEVVYYLSDLPALVAALVAHLMPRGRAFVLVTQRDWSGPLAAERATAADLEDALAPHGEVKVTAMVGHSGSLEGNPARLVELVRGDDEIAV